MLAYVKLHRGDEVPERDEPTCRMEHCSFPSIFPAIKHTKKYFNLQSNTCLSNSKHPYTILTGKTHKGNTLSEEQTLGQK